MSSQSRDTHRALLRVFVIHALRAAGFHSTKPSVLDTIVDLAERFFLLLASTTAQHALSSHNDSIPTITDVRMALSDCGVLIPCTDASQEAWQERMRKPLCEVAAVPQGGKARMIAEKRKRDDEDTKDVRDFTKWYDGAQHREIKRIAGIIPDESIAQMGVGGQMMQGEDFFTALKKKMSKAADDIRLQGTALGRPADSREVVIEGGPVQHIRDWRPKSDQRATHQPPQQNNNGSSLSSPDRQTKMPKNSTPDIRTQTAEAVS